MRALPPHNVSIASGFSRSSLRREVLGSARNADPRPPDRQAPLAFCALTCTIVRNRFRARGSRRSAGAASETRSAPRDPIDALGGASCVVARGEPSEPSSGLFPTAGNRIGELFLRNGGLPDAPESSSATEKHSRS